MTTIAVSAIFLLVWVTIIAPAFDGWRRRRAELSRVGGRVVVAPRFDGGRRRVDPSPVPRRRGAV